MQIVMHIEIPYKHLKKHPQKKFIHQKKHQKDYPASFFKRWIFFEKFIFNKKKSKRNCKGKKIVEKNKDILRYKCVKTEYVPHLFPLT